MRLINSLFFFVVYLGLGLLTLVALVDDLPMRQILPGIAPLSAYAHILAFPLVWFGMMGYVLLYVVAVVVSLVMILRQ